MITAPVAARPRTPPPSTPAPAPRRVVVSRPVIVAVGVWATLVLIAALWGAWLLHAGVHMQIKAPPLTGRPAWRVSWRVLVPVAAGAVAVVGLPVAARRLRWRSLLLVSAATTAVWSLAIDFVDGWRSVTAPVHTEYAATAARIASPAAFLAHFTTDVRQYNLHTQGHPPAMELVLWLVGRAGWHGAGAAAALYIAVGSLAGVAALIALRDLAGEQRARVAAPAVAIAPAAIWLATSGDAFFAGVSAWAVALVVLATGCDGRRSDRLAVAGGLCFGLTAFLSYGLVLLALVPVAVAVSRRRARPIALAALAAAVVFALFFAAGFSWFTGLRVTHARYYAGVASRRPYAYFLLADLAAFALAVGPAAAAGLARLRDRATWLLVGGTLAVVALADLSGMSKAEVERIWLPFVPWVLLATAAFGRAPGERGVSRRLRAIVAAQVVVALAIQVAIKSPW